MGGKVWVAACCALLGCGDAGVASEPDADPCPPGLDPFEVVSHEVVGAGPYVRLDVQYTGGCAEHDFAVWWTGVAAPSCPASVPVELQHYAHGDMCDSVVDESIWIDLTPTLDRIGFCNGALDVGIWLGGGGSYGFRLEESAPPGTPPDDEILAMNLDCGVITVSAP